MTDATEVEKVVERLLSLMEKATPQPWARANLANITIKIVADGARLNGEPCPVRYTSYHPVDDLLATEAVNALPLLLSTLSTPEPEKERNYVPPHIRAINAVARAVGLKS